MDEIKEELGLDEKNKKTEEKVEEKEAEKVEKEEENIFAEILQQKLTVGYNPIKDNISPSEKTRIINEIIENNKQFPKNKNLTENHWGVLIDALNKINYIKSFTKENIQTRDVTEIQQKYERQQQEQQQKQQQKQKEREQQEQKEREQKEQKEQKVEYKQQKDYSVDINKWCASDNNTQQYCENENIKSKTSADQQKLVDQYENNLLYGGRKRKTKRRRRRGGVKSPTKNSPTKKSPTKKSLIKSQRKRTPKRKRAYIAKNKPPKRTPNNVSLTVQEMESIKEDTHEKAFRKLFHTSGIESTKPNKLVKKKPISRKKLPPPFWTRDGHNKLIRLPTIKGGRKRRRKKRTKRRR